ncbi:MAG TPA: MFS transporter [Streptosporangiaceae bacterium]|nr:MFS transporter [Streptosporangiaceae bacterium]
MAASMAAECDGGQDAAAPAGPSATLSLARHADFNKLWAGQAVSSVGSEVTKLALPLTAVLYLHASAVQVGLMVSAQLLAYCGPSLLFGVLADRVRRRPLMVGADLGRAAVLGLVPALAWAGSLSMAVLYAVALIHGALTVIFEVAYRSYLPSLLAPEDLLSGNSRLQSTESVAQIAGPGLSGALVDLLRAPFALLVDATSFLVSAASVLWIRAPEPALQRVAGRRGVRGVFADVGQGLRFIYRQPVLRALAGSGATFNFFSQLQLTLFVLYAARRMHMSPGAIGIVLAFFGIGGAAAAVTVKRLIGRVGYGPTLLAGYAMGALAILGIPLVPGPPALSTGLFTAVYFLAGFGIVTANIAMMTLRQVATPASLQGRVSASFRFALGALMPFSAALAGLLGERLGLRATLFVTAAGMPISVVWVALSPARRVRAAEELTGADAADGAPALAAGLSPASGSSPRTHGTRPAEPPSPSPPGTPGRIRRRSGPSG